VRAAGVPREASRVALPILAGAPAIYQRDPKGSLRARRAFPTAARALFEAGFEAVSLAVREGVPVYVMARR
jgi:hypothetical protein